MQLFNGLQAHLRVWLNQGDASFEPAVDLAFEPYVKMLSAVGDFDGDGLADVVDFYNQRFNIALTVQEKSDLVAFLAAL